MKKVISLVLVIVMLCSTFVGLQITSAAADLPSSGSCGENVTYTFDSATGLLTISGTGAMKDFSGSSTNRSPFYNQGSIKSLVIENGVTSIGNSAFSGCSGLTSITIPDSVTSIGNNAFYGCSGLTSVTIGNSVKSIGSYAFYNCSGLISITIPDSVTSIGDYAFRGCGLTSLTIPNSVTSIGGYAFYGCSGLTSITVDSGNTQYDSRGNCNAIIKTSTNTLVIGCKNTVIPNTVTSVGSSAFQNCSGLTSIIIPDSVTSIGGGAFSDCSGLTSITIPDSVTSIGDYAFYYCSGLTSVTIGNSVTSIGHDAFYGCSSLTSITIPDSVTSIGYGAFYGCSGLTSVTIGNSVTSIGSNAFRDCSGLTSVTIPDSVTSIGDYAFHGCSGLTSITVDSDNTQYDSRGNCNAIIKTSTNTLVTGCKNTVIPNTVTRIGDYAFQNCSGLTSITIPNSVTRIGDYAFYGCKAVAYAGSANGSPWGANAVGVSIDDYFLYYDKEKTQIEKCISSSKIIVIPDSVTSIGDSAFDGCSGLTSITIPDSVTSIGIQAFRHCKNLKSVVLPASVKEVGGEAFWYCPRLETITVQNMDCAFGPQAVSFGTKMIAPLDSTAHEFARNYNMEFIELGSEIPGEHRWDAGVVTKPTATTLGYTTHTCSLCGDTYTDTYKSPTGKPAGFKCASRTATAEKFTWTKTAGVSGYQIQLLNSAGKNAGLKALTTNSYTFAKLAAGHAYKARIRFFIKAADGKNYFGAWSTITSPTLPAGSAISKLTPAKKAFTAQWKKASVTGYQLQYATNAKFTKAAAKTVKGAAKVKLALKSLKGGAKYFVRVRTYKTIGGKNYYSAWSGAKAVITKK